MARVHIDLEQKFIPVGFGGTKFCAIFCRFPIHHLAIVEGGLHKDGRVILSGNVRVGAIGFHVIILFLFLRIAPFLEFRNRER